MPEPLIEEYRGGILDLVHYGRVCVVNDKEQIIYGVGDINALTFYRSAAKPIQALPVLVRGLNERYGLSSTEIAIMAGSHAGEAMHLETIESMLRKTGFSEDELIMHPVYPAFEEQRLYYIKNGMSPRKALHNCAGKHLALLMLTRELGGDYWRPCSPAQQEVIRYVAYFSGWPVDKTGVGIDGCGVPVFAVPLYGIAKAFMKLACHDVIEDRDIGAAAAKMTESISLNPYMVRGHGYICGEFNTDANVVAKGGALGVYGFGLKKERVGVAFKMEDGIEALWPMVVAEILRQLKYDNPETIRRVEALLSRDILNDNKTVVGERKTAFRLKKY